jgi:hypothetical protein
MAPIDIDQLRSTPSKVTPRASMARRDRVLRASVFRSTRATRRAAEGMAHQQQLGLGVDPRALRGCAEPGTTDLDGAKIVPAGPVTRVPVRGTPDGAAICLPDLREWDESLRSSLPTGKSPRRQSLTVGILVAGAECSGWWSASCGAAGSATRRSPLSPPSAMTWEPTVACCPPLKAGYHCWGEGVPACLGRSGCSLDGVRGCPRDLRPGVSVHGHMADSVGAANVILQHLRSSERM